MALFGAGVAMLVAFVLRLVLPRADGSPSPIARNEHVTSAYSVLLVALFIGAWR